MKKTTYKLEQRRYNTRDWQFYSTSFLRDNSYKLTSFHRVTYTHAFYLEKREKQRWFMSSYKFVWCIKEIYKTQTPYSYSLFVLSNTKVKESNVQDLNFTIKLDNYRLTSKLHQWSIQTVFFLRELRKSSVQIIRLIRHS